MKIIRLVNVHNEEDILEYNLKWYIDQGISTIAINNSSTDRSKDILYDYLGKGILEVSEVSSNHFDRFLLFDSISKLAHKYSPDWIVFADADEFYEPVSSKFNNLIDLITYSDNKNTNAIRFHNMEFWMTEKDDLSIENPIKRIKYYSYFDSNRIKVFKFYEGFTLTNQRGHAPTFPKENKIILSDEEGISRHYKFRSLEQAYYKITRVIPEPGKKDFGFHYLKLGKKREYFIIPSSRLIKYEEDKNWCFKRVFDGNRMSETDLIQYLGLKDVDELDNFFKKRRL